MIQAGDKSFKEELGKIIDVDIWESAKENVGIRLRELQLNLTRLQQSSNQHREYLAKYQVEVSFIIISQPEHP